MKKITTPGKLTWTDGRLYQNVSLISAPMNLYDVAPYLI
jgi:hypothetical protein